MSLEPIFNEDSSVAEQAWFFRAADRLRLEGYVSALTQNGMSLSMVSSHDAILDHYGKLLIARLREVAPNFEVEVYFPVSSEALIDRFNHVLHDHSIADAMASQPASAPPKVWIVHDASALPDHELQLLARLVQNFPGANIRIVLLVTHASQKQSLLSMFGRRILSWDIEAPNQEQRDALLAQARAQGREAQINAVLMQLGSQAVAPVGATPERAPANPAGQPKALVQPTPGGKVKSRKARWLIASVLLLAVCSLGVAHWYNRSALPDLAALIWDNARASLSGSPKPAPGAQDERNRVPTLPAPASTLQPAHIAPRDVEEILFTPAQAQAGQTWLLNMASGTFVVVHATEPSFHQARSWLQSQTQLRFAQIVAHRPPQQSSLHFSIISGPFSSSTEASGYADNPSFAKGASVQSTQSMKEQIPSEFNIRLGPGSEEKR